MPFFDEAGRGGRFARRELGSASALAPFIPTRNLSYNSSVKSETDFRSVHYPPGPFHYPSSSIRYPSGPMDTQGPQELLRLPPTEREKNKQSHCTMSELSSTPSPIYVSLVGRLPKSDKAGLSDGAEGSVTGNTSFPLPIIDSGTMKHTAIMTARLMKHGELRDISQVVGLIRKDLSTKRKDLVENIDLWKKTLRSIRTPKMRSNCVGKRPLKGGHGRGHGLSHRLNPQVLKACYECLDN